MLTSHDPVSLEIIDYLRTKLGLPQNLTRIQLTIEEGSAVRVEATWLPEVKKTNYGTGISVVHQTYAEAHGEVPTSLSDPKNAADAAAAFHKARMAKEVTVGFTSGWLDLAREQAEIGRVWAGEEVTLEEAAAKCEPKFTNNFKYTGAPALPEDKAAACDRCCDAATCARLNYCACHRSPFGMSAP